MTVRSSQLVRRRDLAAITNVNLYTTPVDRRTIVKEVSVTTNATQAMSYVLSIVDGASVVFVEKGAVAADTTKRSERWFVLNEGQILRLTTIGPGSTDVVISGAELVE